MSVADGKDRGFQRSPTGPQVAPPREPADRPPAPPRHVAGNKRRVGSVAVFVLLMLGFGIRAYKDLSRPEAWDYWKDLYVSPSMMSTLVANARFDETHFDKVGPDGSGGGERVLFIRGIIGPAAASWFRDRVDEAHLVAGDTILLSSPGGDLDQALIMGEIIRSRGFATAVGVADAVGRVTPSYCASACVLVYAGGKTRFGIEGSALGVHRFVTTAPVRDPIAEAQRIAGAVLSYMTRMGVSSTIVTAMSETKDIRWLDAKEASAMNLVTDPIGGP